MKKFLNKVLIIDGNYQLIRNMKMNEQLKTSDGMESGGFYGFFRSLHKSIKTHPGYYPIICWDSGHSPRRLNLFPNYKHHADKAIAPPIPGSTDDLFIKSLREQKSDLIECLNNLRIPNLMIKGWEGDDLIYIMSQCSNDCIIVSDDKDFIQLAAPGVKIDRVMNGVLIDHRTIEKGWSYPLYEYWKILMGDPSDNLRGAALEGMGSKTCTIISEWIHDYVLENGIDPTDTDKIWEFLKSVPADKVSKVRGLSKKWNEFIKESEEDNPNFISCKDRFDLNSRLMDLRHVVIPEDFQVLFESAVVPTLESKPKLLEIYKYLNKYQISGFDPSTILSKLSGAGSVIIK